MTEYGTTPNISSEPRKSVSLNYREGQAELNNCFQRLTLYSTLWDMALL